MSNNIVCVPSWWYNAITGVGQQFENPKKVRFTLIYYTMTMKLVYVFVKNDKKVTVIWVQERKNLYLETICHKK